MLWTFENGRAYLVPTVHFLSRHDYPMRREYAKAYTKSDVIMFESNFLAPEMKAFGKTDEEGSISSAGADLVAQVTAAFLELGLSSDGIESMRPHFASMLISAVLNAREGCSGEYGLDSHLRNRAMANGKAIRYLESPTIIDEIAKSIPFELQVAELRRAIENLDTVRGRIRKILKAWREAKLEELAASLSEIAAEAPGFWSPIIGGRNQSWLPEILRIHESGERTLICVGALHCVGVQSLPALIASAGVQLTYS